MSSFSEQKKILSLLKTKNKGLTVGDIAKELGLNRNSSAKYLDILFSQGNVELRQIGPAKLYFPAQRVPISQLLDYSSNEILVLDSQYKILQVNRCVLQDLKLPKEEILGKHIEEIPVNAIKNEDFLKNLHNLNGDKEVIGEYMYYRRKKRFFYKYKLIKSCFDSGTCGITIIFENITSQKEYERSLKKTAKLNEITFEIASDFIYLKKEELPKKINTSLTKITQTIDVDRTFIVLFDKELESFKVIYYSMKEGVSQSPFEINKEYPLSIYSFWLEQFKEFEICFLDASKIQKNDSIEKQEFIKKVGVKSMIAAPMISEGDLIGFVGFSTLEKPKYWSESTINFSRSLAHLFSQILRKKGDLE